MHIYASPRISMYICALHIHAYPSMSFHIHENPCISITSMQIHAYPCISMRIHAYACISVYIIDKLPVNHSQWPLLVQTDKMCVAFCVFPAWAASAQAPAASSTFTNVCIWRNAASSTFTNVGIWRNASSSPNVTESRRTIILPAIGKDLEAACPSQVQLGQRCQQACYRQTKQYILYTYRNARNFRCMLLN